ncbi:LysR family transcriptional regulator [Pseudomonas guariconensis]|uniref:LysR family transcriptional regulator n=1 Tax=Pseudomonas TaxID=286 RepID=UPI001CE42F4A|nr:MULTISPECIES: LysR family transcriptional regulator [Pseudomonas]MCO7640257.1 LysR family transcriptional regulator [Pseudomonas sp. S 311-6]MCO7515987.1 LysR family transcriptional regulator [Pseudomonas putida]MCO7565551.1 LysR family transcriptional regulator [Pseudomonas mosselii]MCO7593231.1 LysR family transcriptional regulator [Pseudomonas guariconensis]MCO7606414.1 LysR family transcriptional regulator [Pseudomonas guariconensis]
MAKEPYSQLLALVAVARERSFTRAAAQLGMSQSMLSHTIRTLEAQMGVRLLTRTTRSVSVTEAGERLLASVAPRLEAIEAQLHAVAEFGDTVSGTLRITASDHAIDTLLWPKLAPVLAQHPRLHLELHADYAFTDIVQGRFDFGVRLGDGLAKNICAVPIGPPFGMAIIGTPAYFATRERPRTPADLMTHACINLRLPTHGNLYAWELKHGEQEMNVRVPGRLVFNGIYQVLNAALDGHGLAYVPEDLARPHLESGRALPVLEQWWRSFPGFHLYYAAHRETSRAMQVVIDALRLAD